MPVPWFSLSSKSNDPTYIVACLVMCFDMVPVLIWNMFLQQEDIKDLMETVQILFVDTGVYQILAMEPDEGATKI